jgi:hypothetical protein
MLDMDLLIVVWDDIVCAGRLVGGKKNQGNRLRT